MLFLQPTTRGQWWRGAGGVVFLRSQQSCDQSLAALVLPDALLLLRLRGFGFQRSATPSVILPCQRPPPPTPSPRSPAPLYQGLLHHRNLVFHRRAADLILSIRLSISCRWLYLRVDRRMNLTCTLAVERTDTRSRRFLPDGYPPILISLFLSVRQT